ncbi:MAG: hypothetical protein Tsb0020_16240 [Haliangiales bacterium]
MADEEQPTEQGTASAKLVTATNTTHEDQRQQAALSVGNAILAALRGGPRRDLPDDPITPVNPTEAQEFVEALESLHETGWAFDAALPPRLGRLSNQPPTQSELDTLTDLQEKYPALPQEVAELVWFALTGNPLDEQLVGDSDAVAVKLETVYRLVITEAYREHFYLQQCSKLPRYHDIDWEVVIKASERGHQNPPWYPYALVTLDTVDTSQGHHEHLDRAHLVPRPLSPSREHEDARSPS